MTTNEETAGEVVEAWAQACREFQGGRDSFRARVDIHNRIAAALAAAEQKATERERERCAKVAESDEVCEASPNLGPNYEDGWMDAGDYIAEKIRAGEGEK